MRQINPEPAPFNHVEAMISSERSKGWVGPFVNIICLFILALNGLLNEPLLQDIQRLWLFGCVLYAGLRLLGLWGRIGSRNWLHTLVLGGLWGSYWFSGWINPVDQVEQIPVLSLLFLIQALAFLAESRLSSIQYGVYLLLSLAPALFWLQRFQVGVSLRIESALVALAVCLWAVASRILHEQKRSAEIEVAREKLISSLNQSQHQIVDMNQMLAMEVHERTLAQDELGKINHSLEAKVQERTEALRRLNVDLLLSQNRLTQAIDAAEVGFWDWQIPENILHHSHFDLLLGYEESELHEMVQNLRQIVHPEDTFKVLRALVAHMRQRTPHYRAAYRIRHKRGFWVWVEDRGRVTERNEQGVAVRMLGIRRDITQERNAREKDRLSATVFRVAEEGIFILDEDFRFLAINPYYASLYGISEEQVLNCRIDECHSVPGMRRFYQQITDFLRRDGHWESEFNDYKKNGESFQQWLRISSVRDERGQISHYVGLITDVTARREAEKQIVYLDNYDKLTGFANRQLFRSRLEERKKSAEEGQKQFAVLFMDLDRFKQVNNSLGHEVGDALLKEAANRLARVRVDADCLARFGGDEFAVFLDELKSRRDVEDFCGRVVGEIRRPFRIEQHEILLGCSLGISLYPEHGADAQTLLNHADIALQQAKRVGGNSWRFYSEDLRASSIEQVNLESQLRKAIFRDEFVVYYQPKISLKDNQLMGVEALVRWNHPSLGLLAPSDFMPMAEESGLVSAISELVLEKACRQIQFWIESGVGRIKTSVNVSAHQLRKGTLLQIVQRVLDITGVDPHLLELELTESSLMEDSEGTLDTLHRLRNMGIELSLDDFGTGYSSLSYLKKFPINTLKIDQAFIRDLSTSPDDEAITKAIIAMAHSLNLSVMAEGVETEAIRDFLKAEQCDGIQGYLVSRPVPESELAPFLKRMLRSSTS